MTRNKYRRLYLAMINHCRKRKEDSDTYYERHHILPKSIWSEYKSKRWNIVKLTAREHFIAHKLLVRFIDGPAKAKMQSALWMMANASGMLSKRSSEYERLRRAHADSRAKTYRVFKDGQSITFSNLRQFCRDNGINDGNLHSLVTGKTKFCQGYTLTPVRKPSKGKGQVYTVSKDGVNISVDNLKDFCRQNGLSYTSMFNVVRGFQPTHKGYSVDKRSNGRVMAQSLSRRGFGTPHDQQ